MLDDIAQGSGTLPMLLTQPQLAGDVVTGATTIALDATWSAIEAQPISPIDQSTPRHLAYVIYTSAPPANPKA